MTMVNSGLKGLKRELHFNLSHVQGQPKLDMVDNLKCSSSFITSIQQRFSQSEIIYNRLTTGLQVHLNSL